MGKVFEKAPSDTKVLTTYTGAIPLQAKQVGSFNRKLLFIFTCFCVDPISSSSSLCYILNLCFSIVGLLIAIVVVFVALIRILFNFELTLMKLHVGPLNSKQVPTGKIR
ncbi:hypothetical protein GQX74_003193 [Glossina fuscipes]|nr:hypothetical protein GQX74_003193 [Glossina fuscipes]